MFAFHRLSVLFVVLCSVLLHVNGLPLNNRLARYDPSAIHRSEGGPLPARQDDISSHTLKRVVRKKPPPVEEPLSPMVEEPLSPIPESPIDKPGSTATAPVPPDDVVKLLLKSRQFDFTANSLNTLPNNILLQKFAMTQLLADFGKEFVKQFGSTTGIKTLQAKVNLLAAEIRPLFPPPVPPKDPKWLVPLPVPPKDPKWLVPPPVPPKDPKPASA